MTVVEYFRMHGIDFDQVKNMPIGYSMPVERMSLQVEATIEESGIIEVELKVRSRNGMAEGRRPASGGKFVSRRAPSELTHGQ